MHGPVRRIANLGAAHVLAVHAVVMIDEVTRGYAGVATEIRVGRRPRRLNPGPSHKAVPPAMLQHATAIVHGGCCALHADGAVASCRVLLKLGIDLRLGERRPVDVVIVSGIVERCSVGRRTEDECCEHDDVPDINVFHGDLLLMEVGRDRRTRRSTPAD